MELPFSTVQDLLVWSKSHWRIGAEIAVFWFAYYYLLSFLKNTGGLQILRGLSVIVVLIWASHALELEVISTLMRAILPISVIAFLILFFQYELRRGLSRIGQSRLFKLFLKEERLVDEIVKSITALSKKKIGALLAIEKEVSLKQYAESGIPTDANLTFELISTVFMPNTPLHDGGMIVQGTRIQAAGCLFPLSQNPHLSKELGTRHRAALGLTEESDALVFVVSEESGTISFAEKGELQRGLNEDELRSILTALYLPQRQSKGWLSFIRGEKKHVSAAQD